VAGTSADARERGRASRYAGSIFSASNGTGWRMLGSLLAIALCHLAGCQLYVGPHEFMLILLAFYHRLLPWRLAGQS
jgi:hypothetical protein